jgi:hypothetical protein
VPADLIRRFLVENVDISEHSRLIMPVFSHVQSLVEKSGMVV